MVESMVGLLTALPKSKPVNYYPENHVTGGVLGRAKELGLSYFEQCWLCDYLLRDKVTQAAYSDWCQERGLVK